MNLGLDKLHLPLWLVLLAVASPVRAQPGEDSAAWDLQFRPWTHGTITAAAAAGWLLPELGRGPAPCRWCDRDADGIDTLNGLDAAVRRSWRWEDRNRADRLSDLGVRLTFALPLGALLATHGGLSEGFGGDALIVLEATAISGAISQVAKFGLRRERPWAHANDPPPGEHMDSSGANYSFFSGHTSSAFALATSTGAVASIRGYRGAPWVWGVGLSLAAATGYLRIAADGHYFSDVLVGAAVGTAVGLLVPHLLHKERVPPQPGAGPPAMETVGPMLGVVLRPAGAPRGGAVVLGAGLRGTSPYLAASCTW
jgi:membrane-associated phospholipid phosphatase